LVDRSVADRILNGKNQVNRQSCHRTARRAVGPQIGYLFPIGGMQGYVNLKGYGEFAAENRPQGWNAWLTLAFSPKAEGPVPPGNRPPYR
jgi:hypothetical protein